jgi:hypothetical protein
MFLHFLKGVWDMKSTIALANSLAQLPNGDFIALPNHPAIDNAEVGID